MIAAKGNVHTTLNEALAEEQRESIASTLQKVQIEV
jgi:hypothetical protein